MGRQNSVGTGLHAWVVPSNEARSTMKLHEPALRARLRSRTREGRR
jgi:hypothetical protein